MDPSQDLHTQLSPNVLAKKKHLPNHPADSGVYSTSGSQGRNLGYVDNTALTVNPVGGPQQMVVAEGLVKSMTGAEISGQKSLLVQTSHPKLFTPGKSSKQPESTPSKAPT